MRHLLLLHGALGSKKNFDHISSELSNTYIIHKIDFEGHGNSTSNEEFSIQLFTKNTLDYIKSKGLEKVCIFGYSMGGYVALNLAHSHPHIIEKIATYGTKFDWSIESAEKEVKMLNPDKIEEKVPAFAKSLKETQFPNDWKEVMHKTKALMTKLGYDPLLNDKLQEIQTKITIGISDSDKMVTIKESEFVSQSLSNGTLKTLQGLPHPIDQIPKEHLIQYIKSEF